MKDTIEQAQAADLREGDVIDLEGDPFATRPREDADEQERLAHESTVSTFQFEYAQVESVERETDTCVVVHTDATSFGCPPDHQIKRVMRGDPTT
jgi:phosphoribosylaminoimidazole carboxylase (NCAIR synthetase)